MVELRLFAANYLVEFHPNAAMAQFPVNARSSRCSSGSRFCDSKCVPFPFLFLMLRNSMDDFQQFLVGHFGIVDLFGATGL
jgi:hypothetical protein